MSARRIDRFTALFVICAALFALVVGRLFVLQVVQVDFWEREALQARTSGKSIPFERGWIFDRNRLPLALTESTFDLRFVFGNYRKESTVGQIGMVYFLLGGDRPDPESIYFDPDPYVARLLDLSPLDAAGLESTQAQEDLIFYLEALFRPDTEPNAGALAWGPDAGEAPFGGRPGFERMGEAICARVKTELEALEALEVELRVQPGTLFRLPGASAARADRRVAMQLEKEGAEADSYRSTRRYHSEFDYYEEYVLQKIPHGAVMNIAVNEELYPGFYVVESTERSYPEQFADLCPNLIGKMGQPSPERLASWEEHRRRLADLSFVENKTDDEILETESLLVWLREIDVTPGEEVGALGLECLLDPVLRGKRGYVFLERDRLDRSRIVRDYTPPIRGQDVVLTLDSGLQAACERALDRSGRAGAVVLMDPGTGAVLALASSPRPARLQLIREFSRLAEDPARPLMNRGICGWDLPPPGSIFKLVTAIAALEEQRVPGGVRYLCEGRLEVGDSWMKCEGFHHEIDLAQAISKSCNIFFYKLSRELDYDLLFRWSGEFGFGRSTGFLDAGLYNAVFAEHGVREEDGPLKLDERGEANLMRFCIGQGAIDDVTPLQVARMIAGIATGLLPQPYLIMQIGDRPTPVPPRRKLPVSAETFRIVREAMIQVALTGTAAPDPAVNLDLTRYRIAGKTGTAQVAAGPSHAWFAGYLPHERPAIAFAVFVESCGRHGGEVAAPLFQRVLEQEETAVLLEGALQ